MLSESLRPFERFAPWLFALLCVGFFLKIVSGATVIDDAYITFRVVDNFLNGYGLRWNIDERVQVYTHPLWMLLHIPLYALIGNIYFTSIILSTACGVLAVWITARIVHPSWWHKATFLIAPLYFERTFRAYVICGLETPLSFCLFAWFISEWVNRARYYRLCLIAALCILVRFDNAVLLTPALAYVTWMNRSQLRVGKLLTSGSPLILWCAFSLFYYGFILPNTKYAKTENGIPLADYVGQGLKYLFNFSYFDTFSFLLLLGATGYAIAYGVKTRWALPPADALEGKVALLGAGVLLHVLYVVTVGGDYMCGRFFAVPAFVSVIIGFLALHRVQVNVLPKCLLAMLTVHVMQFSVISPASPNVNNYHLNDGINNHTDMYRGMNGLFSDPEYFFRREVNYDRSAIPRYNPDMPTKVGIQGFIGYPGFFSQRDVIIIDIHALSDPLLARLPVKDPNRWRIGHFPREIPAGYIYARQTGDTSHMEPSLAKYYEKLRLVTSGDLWSAERFGAIWGFQVGAYDKWRDEYLARQKP